MELYNVMKLNRQAFPLPTQPRSIKDKEQSLNIEASERGGETPVQPLPLHDKERSAPVIYLEQQHSTTHSYDGAKTETSSMTTTSLSRDEEEFSISNASDLESEWVEQDEGGVYITIRALPSGRRELRRVRFSREKFGEMHARVWWEENRARIHRQYL
ncbi:unnamed protein product [Cuscuta europaea]|uniref:BRX domain-containing protein n=1 Tax=Cuscuta europaea TaxID=41803 RepID=A0A9P0ZFT2_CUSEU|nr:unnamed protein product [Cuscuta europaea]